MVEKSVLYFDKPGARCTGQVLQATKRCLADGGPNYLVVASVSGRTALRFAKEVLRPGLTMVAVTGPPSWQLYDEYVGVCPVPELKQQLEGLGVVVVDRMVSSFSDTIDFSYARYGFVPPSWLIVETLLAVGGYGLKTAVEVTVMATDAGAVPPFTEVLAVAGTDKGADTAAVVISTFANQFFSSVPERRLQVREILAMPRNKVWYKEIGGGDWRVKELQVRPGSREGNQ